MQHPPTLNPFKQRVVMDACSLGDPLAEQTGLQNVRNPAGEAPTFVQPTQDKPQAEPSPGHPALFPGGPSLVTTAVLSPRVPEWTQAAAVSLLIVKRQVLLCAIGANIQTHADTKRGTCRYANTHAQTDTHPQGHTDTHSHRDTQIYTQPQGHTDTHSQGHRHIQLQEHTDTHSQGHADTHSHKDIQTHTPIGTHRHTQPQGHTDTHRNTQNTV